MFVAINAARIDMGTAGALIRPTIQAKSDSKAPPTTDAAVPSALIAPSVPGSTRSKVVIRKVVFPYALPISDANVSDSFVANEAAKPRTYIADGIPRKDAPCAEQIAHINPVAAEPLKIMAMKAVEKVVKCLRTLSR